MQDAFENWMDNRARDVRGTWFDGKVVGVTQPGRQEAIGAIVEYDELTLAPEPENSFDRDAIAVRSPAGEQIGYLDKRLAGEITRRTQHQGMAVRCFVRCVRDTPSGKGVSFGLLQWKQTDQPAVL